MRVAFTFVICLLFSTLMAHGQSPPAPSPAIKQDGRASAGSKDTQRQIDDEVWIPFFAASNAFDAAGFLAVQSKDLVRISADSKQIYELDRYQTEIREGFKRARERGIVRKSEVRFLERIVSGHLAYETGYFRSQATLPGGEVRIRYTKFEFVLRKEGGRWKILVDKDTAENGTITEEMFQAAAPMRREQ